MPFGLKVIEDHSYAPQEFRICGLDDHATCIATLASEYCKLRTECAVAIDSLSVEGIGVFDTSQIHSFLKSKTIPYPKIGNFDVVRSDMGETLAYIIFEQEYKTYIGYKNVRDRELIQLPGRGIDAVGVENDDELTLLIGEVKVSDEDRNPPRVVDYNEDSISKSLINHINDHEETSRKIWNIARRIREESDSKLFLSVALYWDYKMWSHLRVVCCGVLVRPVQKYNDKDFGLLKEEPELVAPGKVRFIIVCVDGDLNEVVSEFYRLATDAEEAPNE